MPPKHIGYYKSVKKHHLTSVLGGRVQLRGNFTNGCQRQVDELLHCWAKAGESESVKCKDAMVALMNCTKTTNREERLQQRAQEKNVLAKMLKMVHNFVPNDK